MLSQIPCCQIQDQSLCFDATKYCRCKSYEC